MYAVGYVRVSTGEQYATPEVQEKLIREECSRRGWHVIDVFKDIGISGAVDPFDREGFRQAVEELRQRGGGVIVVYALDRLLRSFSQFSELMARLYEMNIFVHSVRESYLTELGIQNPQIYRLILMILGWVGSVERRLISERTKIALSNPEVRKKKMRRFKEVLGCKLYTEISNEIKEAVVSLYRSGFSYAKIARALGLSTYMVRKILAESGVIDVDPTRVCPRCFHRMELDVEQSTPLRRTYVCKNCGYEYVVTTRV